MCKHESAIQTCDFHMIVKKSCIIFTDTVNILPHTWHPKTKIFPQSNKEFPKF